MLKRLMDHRGAVSVFLVIVLVPMIACASLFVDASRVRSARSLVASAGDLTLNTVLSQYDVDLNDFYGMMASAQDMKDVLDAADDYFTACIKSQGIDTTDIGRYVNSIKGLVTGGDDISDLLGIDLADGSKASVAKVKDGSLTNPALIKTQIVEFMKFRSPINAIVSLFERFKSSSNELENSAKTSDLIDSKQTYYEAQGEVAKKAYEIYQLIEKYKELNVSTANIQKVKTLLSGNSLKEQYLELHKTMTRNLYNTSDLKSNLDSIKWVSPVPSQYSPKSANNNVQENKLKKQIDSTLRALDQFITARNNFNNNNNILPWNNNYYDIQYAVYCCKKKSLFTNVSTRAENLTNAFRNLWDMVEHADANLLTNDYPSTYNSSHLGVKIGTTKSIQDWYDYLDRQVRSEVKTVSNSQTKYNTCVNKIKNITQLDTRISPTSTNNSLANLYQSLNEPYQDYKKAFNLLTDIVKGLVKLKKLVKKADDDFDTWGNKADEYSVSKIQLAESDQTEISEVKSQYQKLKLNDIQDYIDHINNVKSALGTITKAIESVKFNDQSIIKKKIKDLPSFEKNSLVSASDIPMVKADLDAYAGEYSGSNPNGTFNFSMDASGLDTLNITDKNDPDIANAEKFVVYKWMLDQRFDTPKDEEQEEKYNNKKDEADNQAKEAEEEITGDVSSSNDITSVGNLPSGSSSDLDAGKITTKISEVSSFVGSLFSNFGQTIGQAGVDLRDDLFVLDYITSMFTWLTYEFEAKYDMLDQSQKRDINYETAPGIYSGLSDQWKSTDPEKKYNKSLTNKMRNSTATNWSYCNEVEYIMYGKSVKDARAALNGSIFMIRFALNAPVIFKTFYGDDGLKTFAELVHWATHGIVPAGLVKVLICLGLVALESAKDMKTLKLGIPVILVKMDENDLFVRSWTFLDTKAYPEADKTQKITFSYGDYMKLILFLKLLGSEAYNIYGRIADVVQVNMSKCVLKDSDYALSKSQVYYSIQADVKVKPLMLSNGYTLSFFPDGEEQMESWNKISYKATRGY